MLFFITIPHTSYPHTHTHTHRHTRTHSMSCIHKHQSTHRHTRTQTHTHTHTHAHTRTHTHTRTQCRLCQEMPVHLSIVKPPPMDSVFGEGTAVNDSQLYSNNTVQNSDLSLHMSESHSVTVSPPSF